MDALCCASKVSLFWLFLDILHTQHQLGTLMQKIVLFGLDLKYDNVNRIYHVHLPL